jgi:hypothetical protein
VGLKSFLGGAKRRHFVVPLTQKLAQQHPHRAGVVNDQGAQGDCRH